MEEEVWLGKNRVLLQASLLDGWAVSLSPAGCNGWMPTMTVSGELGCVSTGKVGCGCGIDCIHARTPPPRRAEL